MFNELRLWLRSGTYKTYEEAAKRAGAYSHEKIAEVVTEKTRRFAQRLTRAEAEGSAVAQALDLAQPSGPIAVLDFGGAAGAHYFHARQLVAIPIEWHVVETKAMAFAARRLEDGQLHFHTTIDQALAAMGRRPDVVFSSGTIPYVPDPLAYLEKLAAIKAPLFFLTRLGLTEHTEKPLYGIQRSRLSWNGSGPLPEGFTDEPVSYPFVIHPKATYQQILGAHYQKVEMEQLEEHYILDYRRVPMWRVACK